MVVIAPSCNLRWECCNFTCLQWNKEDREGLKLWKTSETQKISPRGKYFPLSPRPSFRPKDPGMKCCLWLPGNVSGNSSGTIPAAEETSIGDLVRWRWNLWYYLISPSCVGHHGYRGLHLWRTVNWSVACLFFFSLSGNAHRSSNSATFFTPEASACQCHTHWLTLFMSKYKKKRCLFVDHGLSNYCHFYVQSRTFHSRGVK